jgi:hypothetical protein
MTWTTSRACSFVYKLLGSFALLVAGCSPLPDGVRQGPLLVVGAGRSQASYGALAGSSQDFVPGACVEVYADGQRVGRTVVTPDQTFALQFPMRGDARDKDLELRLDDLSGEQRYGLDLPTRSEAHIAYEEGTTPLVARASGLLEFTGWLDPTSRGSEIASVWMVNWSSGAVAGAAPTPPVGEEFTANVPGGRGECASPFSTHGRTEEAVGGVWWPKGGGGCAPPCTQEELLAGTCVSWTGGGWCTGGRGCAILDVDERVSGAPPAELPDEIRTGLPDAGPPDAGPPDLGPVDLGPPDLGSDWGLT